MSSSNNKLITFAGGCFWGVQHYFSKVKGVIKATSGYTSGIKSFPTYEEVCKQETGHAEAVKVEYDVEYTNLVKLLDHFFHITDPTTLNQQKNDIGEQYRSGIYYASEEDLQIIKEYIKLISPYYKDPIVTEVLPMVEFWTAEEYHQEYLVKNPFGYCHLTPKHYKNIKLIDEYDSIENKDVLIEDNNNDNNNFDEYIDFSENNNQNEKNDENLEDSKLIKENKVVEIDLTLENNSINNKVNNIIEIDNDKENEAKKINQENCSNSENVKNVSNSESCLIKDDKI